MLNVGMYQVGLFQYRFYLFLYVLDGITFFGRIAQQVHTVAEIVLLLHGGKGNDERGGWPSVYTYIPRRCVYSNHLIIRTVHVDELSAGVVSFGEQRFVNLLANDAHFPSLFHVDVVDEPSHAHGRCFYLPIFGIYPFHGASGYHFLVEAALNAPFVIARGKYVDAGYRLTYPFQIVRFYIPPAAFAETFICLAGLRVYGKARIGGKALEIGRHHVFQPVTSSHQSHQHEDTPKHPEGGEQTPRLVSGDGDEDFLPSVYVYSE